MIYTFITGIEKQKSSLAIFFKAFKANEVCSKASTLGMKNKTAICIRDD